MKGQPITELPECKSPLTADELQTRYRAGERDFGNINLRCANLLGNRLDGINLSGAHLYQVNLQDACLLEANLSGANLYQANLGGANLCWANLRETTLRKARLFGARLMHADLSSADLRSANLVLANLSEADLSNANLRNANLRKACLCDTNLNRTRLEGADLCHASLRNADLSKAILDFSAWPLECTSFGAKAGDRLIAQLIAHLTRLDTSGCSEKTQEVMRVLAPFADWFCEYRDDVPNCEDKKHWRKWESDDWDNYEYNSC